MDTSSTLKGYEVKCFCTAAKISSDLLPSRRRSPAVAPTLMGVSACDNDASGKPAYSKPGPSERSALQHVGRALTAGGCTCISFGTLSTATFSSGSNDFAALSESESYELRPGFNCSNVS